MKTVMRDPGLVLRAIADLLTPCPPPSAGSAYGLCIHAQTWPCSVTRAYWLARSTHVDPAQPGGTRRPPTQVTPLDVRRRRAVQLDQRTAR